MAREGDIKLHSYYFFDEMINIKNIDPNIIKMEKSSYKNIIFASLKPLYLIINISSEHIEESNGDKYLTLILTDE